MRGVEHIHLMTNRINSRQANLINYVANNPGCTIMDACRHEHSGRGHAASYDAVHRLLRRGLLKARVHQTNRNWTALYVPESQG